MEDADASSTSGSSACEAAALRSEQSSTAVVTKRPYKIESWVQQLQDTQSSVMKGSRVRPMSTTVTHLRVRSPNGSSSESRFE